MARAYESLQHRRCGGGGNTTTMTFVPCFCNYERDFSMVTECCIRDGGRRPPPPPQHPRCRRGRWWSSTEDHRGQCVSTTKATFAKSISNRCTKVSRSKIGLLRRTQHWFFRCQKRASKNTRSAYCEARVSSAPNLQHAIALFSACPTLFCACPILQLLLELSGIKKTEF